jgi:DNA ligase-1
MGMILPTLYKRTATGATQTWEIEVQDDKYRSTSGQIDGIKTTNKWTSCKGKNAGKANATTDAEQALKEAHAKHQKKLERDYNLSIDEIDEKQFYDPMLAQDFKNKNRNKDVYDSLQSETKVFSQPKLDGIRCIATKDGLFTRNGKEITAVPHIAKELQKLFVEYPDAVLDGELYNHAYKDDFNKIVHLVRKQNLTKEHLVESEKMIQYHIYDVPQIGTLDEQSLYSYRIGMLKTQGVPKKLRWSSAIAIVDTTLVKNEKHLDALYSDYTLAGYEGQMIRIDGPYENKRSAKLLKRKDFIDEEYTILGYDEGNGNRTGTIRNFLFKNKKGKEFTSNIKGTFEYLTELLHKAEGLIGKKATVKYFNLTPDGVPRFPIVIAIRDYE